MISVQDFLELLRSGITAPKVGLPNENAAALAPTADDKFAELDINKDKKFLIPVPCLSILFSSQLADDNKDGNLTVEEMLNHENILYNSLYDDSIEDGGFDDIHDEL
ncbi:hypothetical protein CRYUN_Cryun19dG0093200 [Craigia yunnanensis]